MITGPALNADLQSFLQMSVETMEECGILYRRKRWMHP
jgi:hypothetical protein